ncbi:hypothetical protein L484_023421 [Morus notabilis]|uniref:RNase H type-1 domain-containing protein n=1 Tax=Morus notabilis TaxID=981085 RepID=W9S2A3_9ROSA|nr:hypothetical protein L484_023421 [Morus notabilis]
MTNVDAAVVESQDYFSVGGIIRDSFGSVLGAFPNRIAGKVSPFIADRVVLRDGLAFAMSNGWSISVAESDARRVNDFVKSRDGYC